MKFLHFQLLALIISLAACGGGGEPSSSDMEEAYQKILDQSYQQMVDMAGEAAAEGMKPKLYGIEKIACTKATDAAGYQCDVVVDQEVSIMPRRQDNVSIRFVEGDDGWVAINPG